MVVFIIPAELFCAVFAVGVLPAIALKPAVLRGGSAIDDGAGCGMETAYIVYDAIGIDEAVVMLVVNAGAVIIGGNGLAAVEARDKFRGLAVFKLK